VGSTASIFCTVGFINAVGVFIEYYQKHILIDKSTFQITWIAAFTTFICFLAAAPAGIAVDRVGPTVSICAEYLVNTDFE
jgi:MFS family permease